MTRAGLTVERVVRAAADLADEVGFANVTVVAVAKALRVAGPSVYSHVNGLPGLRARVALLAAGDMADRIGLAVAGRAGREAFVAFAGAYRAFALEHPGRYAATQAGIDLSGLAGADGVVRRHVELTHGMLRAYGLREPDRTDAGRLLRSALHGYAVLEATGAFQDARDVEESWSRGLDALHALLSAWPAGAQPGSVRKRTERQAVNAQSRSASALRKAVRR